MSLWTLVCVLGGEKHKRAVAVCEMVGSLQLTPERLQVIPDSSPSLWRASCASSCWVKFKAVLLLVVDSVLALLPFAARRTPLTARLLVGYSFPGWNRGSQLTLVLFVN